MTTHARFRRVFAVAVLAALAALSGSVTAQAGPRDLDPTPTSPSSSTTPARIGTPSYLDPAKLSRGPDPRVAYLMGDTIVDGPRRIAATRLGDHWRLWTTARGYVLVDFVDSRNGFRLVYVSRSGAKRVIARRGPVQFETGTAVSPSRRRIAWGTGRPRVVTVANPDSGRVLARRRLPQFATVIAVSDSRVLLSLTGTLSEARSWWWDYRQNTLTQFSAEDVIRADIRRDRIVLTTGPEDRFCNRVAPLSNPERTLWSSCRISPRAWSPDGKRALATWTYFDENGTDRWLTVRDRTGERLGRVTGRLDWDAVWEDDWHFLTKAQSNRGIAAVIRCTVRGRCERASRIWDTGWDGRYPPFYLSPPVVLSSN